MTTILATLLPEPEQQFIDGNGAPYAGAQLFTYIPNTTTQKVTWLDAGSVTQNANPIILDAAGRAIIYGAGQYRFQLYDVNGNLVYDALTSSSPLAGAGIIIDTNGDFAVNNGPDLLFDTTGRLTWGWNVTNPDGTTYQLTDNDRGAAIGTANATGNLTSTLPDPTTVGNGYPVLFHAGVSRTHTVMSNSANIFSPVNPAGGNSIVLAYPESVVGLYSINNGWVAWAGSGDVMYNPHSTLVYASTAQSIPDSTFTTVTFDTVVENGQNLWNPSFPTRLTVPPGIVKVRVVGNLRYDESNTDECAFQAYIQKNNDTFPGMPHQHVMGNTHLTQRSMNFSSSVIPVAPGDYFEVITAQSTGSSLNTSTDFVGENWFAMELIR